MRTHSLILAIIAGVTPIFYSAPARANLSGESFAALRSAIQAEPGKAGTLVTRALQPVASISSRDAATVTSVAIIALGPQPGTRQVSAIVHAAVRAVPDYVLEIVRAAVLAAPADVADEIAASAVAALPDPWQQVIYRRAGAPIARGERDFKGGPDFKGERDYKEPMAVDGVPMSLAEAVVQTVLDSRAGASAPGIYAAVEAVLRSAPGWLITAIYDPRGISGVGDAGLNNYANEPFRRRPPTLSPSPGPSPVKTKIPATPAPVSP